MNILRLVTITPTSSFLSPQKFKKLTNAFLQVGLSFKLLTKVSKQVGQKVEKLTNLFVEIGQFFEKLTNHYSFFQSPFYQKPSKLYLNSTFI
jgi:hypothetical protein